MNIEKKAKEEIVSAAELLIVEAWAWLDDARDQMAIKAARMSNMPRERVVAFVAPLEKKLAEFEAQIIRTKEAFGKDFGPLKKS
ncbi:MAG: hypothetical protein Q8O91_05640 [Candidatus Aminicenantes bacterium]|nr:hypothetical protein [Candidatus Aminicenantes bacterium]